MQYVYLRFVFLNSIFSRKNTKNYIYILAFFDYTKY